MAVERLDRGIDIENPRLVEQWPDAIIEMPLQPLHAGGLVDLRQRPPQCIFTDHFAHAEQRRIDRIAAQCRDVRVASVPGQHRRGPGRRAYLPPRPAWHRRSHPRPSNHRCCSAAKPRSPPIRHPCRARLILLDLFNARCIYKNLLDHASLRCKVLMTASYSFPVLTARLTGF